MDVKSLSKVWRGHGHRPHRHRRSPRRQVVFAYLSDFTTTTEWDPGTVRTTRESGDGGIGTRYRNVSRFLGRETS